MGPKAGSAGGEVIAQGTPQQIAANPLSLTGQYLTGTKFIAVPKTRRSGTGQAITILGAQAHNLAKIDVKFPLGKFICVTGVSGSGKSTLVNDILYAGLQKNLGLKGQKVGLHQKITNMNLIDKIIIISQEPIGRTPRSNPATYTSVFDDIRDVFTQTPDAKIRGYVKGRFSFNVKGGRCERCSGDGVIKITMYFLPDVYVTCEICDGKRYNHETLQIKYKGKNIYDILQLSIDDALVFFTNHPKIKKKLAMIQEVGLGYIKLGQSAIELSGGEAQRVKLAKELQKKSSGKTMYILDEPTTGLHIDDIKKLIEVLNKIVNNNDTVVVIEHNLDVIKVADYIIDLGPDGGKYGGKVMATGTPEQISTNTKSFTGQYLKKILAKDKLRK